VLGRVQYRNGALRNDLAGLREQVATFDAEVKAVATLREKFDTVNADLRELRQAEAKAVEQLVTFKDALLQTTTSQEAQDQRVHQFAQHTRASSRQECAQIVVRAPQGTTSNQVAAALAQCLPCEQSGVMVRLVTNLSPPAPPTRDPRRQPAVASGAAPAPATATPPRRLVFVATLPTMQLVDGALKGLQCRDLLKARPPATTSSWTTTSRREQMQERIRMRPVQRRLQQSGIIATYRGAQLWQSGGTGRGCHRSEEDLGQGGGCGQPGRRRGQRIGSPDCVPCVRYGAGACDCCAIQVIHGFHGFVSCFTLRAGVTRVHGIKV
jgi:hypothetical protein